MALSSLSFVIMLAVIAIVLLVGFLIVATIQNAFFAVSPSTVIKADSRIPLLQAIYIVYGAIFFLVFMLLALAIRKK